MRGRGAQQVRGEGVVPLVALLKNIIPLILAMPGVIAVTRLPDLPDVDSAIPRLVGVLLPRPNEESGIYAILQTLMAFFQGPAFAILLLGILWRRATGRAALIALLSNASEFSILQRTRSGRGHESRGACNGGDS